MSRLPRSVDELQGLRAARWIRESTRGQLDNFGPDAQHRQQDDAIARFGLVDTGISWTVAHSGRTVDATPAWAQMVAAAGTEYDVLVVGYVSRFSHSAEVHYAVRRTMHDAGAVVLFADERILTSDVDRWEEWHREIGEAEAYSRRLGKRIREGYAAKFRQLADQAGNAPLGFRRSAQPPHRLEVDEASIGQAVGIFRRYALGNISFAALAEQEGLSEERVRKALANPLYNGAGPAGIAVLASTASRRRGGLGRPSTTASGNRCRTSVPASAAAADRGSRSATCSPGCSTACAAAGSGPTG